MSLDDLMQIRKVFAKSPYIYISIFKDKGSLVFWEDNNIIYNGFIGRRANLRICWNKNRNSLEFLLSSFKTLEGQCTFPLPKESKHRVTIIKIAYTPSNNRREYEEVVLFKYKGKTYIMGYTDKRPKINVPFFYDRYTGLYVFLLTKKLFSRIA